MEGCRSSRSPGLEELERVDWPWSGPRLWNISRTLREPWFFLGLGSPDPKIPMESYGHSSPPPAPVTTGAKTTSLSSGDAQSTFGLQLREGLEPIGVLARFMESMLSRFEPVGLGRALILPRGALGAQADPNAAGLVGVESHHSQCTPRVYLLPRRYALGLTSASGFQSVASSAGSWLLRAPTSAYTGCGHARQGFMSGMWVLPLPTRKLAPLPVIKSGGKSHGSNILTQTFYGEAIAESNLVYPDGEVDMRCTQRVRLPRPWAGSVAKDGPKGTVP